jgi:hypothetical protein
MKSKSGSFFSSPETEPPKDEGSEIALTEKSNTLEIKEGNKLESKTFINVSENKNEIKLHPDLKKAGLRAIDTSSLDKKHLIDLPINDEAIIKGLKSQPTEGLRWLAEKAKLSLLKAHIVLKKIHGRVIRVIKQ